MQQDDAQSFKAFDKIKPKMCNPSKVKCPHMTLFEQLNRLLSTKQENEEAQIKCTKRFKWAQDNVKSIMGTEWLEKFVETTEECINETDNDTKKTLKDTSFESFMVCTFLRNSDSPNFQMQCT